MVCVCVYVCAGAMPLPSIVLWWRLPFAVRPQMIKLLRQLFVSLFLFFFIRAASTQSTEIYANNMSLGADNGVMHVQRQGLFKHTPQLKEVY